MRRLFASILLSLACAAPLAGCRWAYRGGHGGGTGAAVGDVSLDDVVRQLGEFTEQLAGKVESAADAKAGVAEAQRMLDSRGGELAARIGAARRGAQAQGGAARGKWLEAEVDNTDRVHRLQLKYSDAAARDPELKARLDKLVADYDSMFKDR